MIEGQLVLPRKQRARQLLVLPSARDQQPQVLHGERRRGVGGQSPRHLALRAAREQSGDLAVEILAPRHGAGLVAGAARRDPAQFDPCDLPVVPQQFAGGATAARQQPAQHGGRRVVAGGELFRDGRERGLVGVVDQPAGHLLVEPDFLGGVAGVQHEQVGGHAQQHRAHVRRPGLGGGGEVVQTRENVGGHGSIRGVCSSSC